MQKRGGAVCRPLVLIVATMYLPVKKLQALSDRNGPAMPATQTS
jgi:hypothetical protein